MITPIIRIIMMIPTQAAIMDMLGLKNTRKIPQVMTLAIRMRVMKYNSRKSAMVADMRHQRITVGGSQSSLPHPFTQEDQCVYSEEVLEVVEFPGKIRKVDKPFHPYRKDWSDKGYDSAWAPAGTGMNRPGFTEN